MKNRPLVAITLKDYKKQIPPEAMKLLTDAGYEIRLNDTGHWLFDPEEHKSFIADADAIIGGVELYTDEIAAAAPGLKVIARYGVGMDSMDLPALKARGIRVGSIVNHDAVAEFTLALMLDAIKCISAFDRMTRRGEWGFISTYMLRGKTVGLIGLGKIGADVAELLRPFGCTVLAYSRSLTQEKAAAHGAQAVSLDELLSRSDIISLHLPATAESRNLIDRAAFAKMKKGAYLINTARGAVVDESALYDALTDGTLSGAALDVFAVEPLPADSPLRGLENVTLTPHMAAQPEETNYQAGITCAQTVVSVLSGGEPPYPVI